MSTSGPSSAVSTVPRSGLPASNGLSQPTGLVPTNNVTTKDGVTVRARIDPTLKVEDVIQQLCNKLKVQEAPIHFALRDETDDLVTNENLRKKIKTKVPLKFVRLLISLRLSSTRNPLFRLVNSPAREAREIADQLRLRDDKTLRLALFSLQKYIRVHLCLLLLLMRLTMSLFPGRAVCTRVSNPRWSLRAGGCHSDKPW